MPDTFEVLCSLQVIIQIIETGQSNKEITALKVTRDEKIFSHLITCSPFTFHNGLRKNFLKSLILVLSHL